MHRIRQNEGFTLVELLVAMVVTCIILTAVATLAFAMSTSSRATEDLSLKQAQIRLVSLKLTELIRQCRLIYNYDDETGSIVIWQQDNGNDTVEADELVLIEAGTERNYIKIQEADSEPFLLVPQCSNVQFGFDQSPPHSKFLNISFEMTEDGIVHQYRIDAGLRSWAGNILDGDNIVGDDD